MGKKEPQNCWEYWKDTKETRENCPAYKTNSGRECWLIASTKCPRVNQDKPNCPKVDRGFKYCWECPWFKKLNPNFEE